MEKPVRESQALLSCGCGPMLFTASPLLSSMPLHERLAGCTSSTVTKVLGRTGRSLHLTALQLEMANLSRVD